MLLLPDLLSLRSDKYPVCGSPALSLSDTWQTQEWTLLPVAAGGSDQDERGRRSLDSDRVSQSLHPLVTGLPGDARWDVRRGRRLVMVCWSRQTNLR